MPGITGFISSTLGDNLETQLHSMVRVMRHEVFYNSGQYVNRDLGVGIGWASPTAIQRPIWNASKDICLVMTGEIFSVAGEQESPAPAENASAFLRLYEKVGLAAIESINGWFSCLLVDSRQSKLLLFNDRYGLQRLYVHEEGESLYFGSEAKSILSVIPSTRELDKAALGEHGSCGCALRNKSIFRGISLLPGGSVWSFRRGYPPTKSTYFTSDKWEGLPQVGPEEFYTELKQTFQRILPRYCGTGDRIGMSLTGGLDGRMIMAYAGWAPEAIPCYTFGGVYRDCTDVRAARKIAAACGQKHQVITVGEAFLKDFPRLAEQAIFVSDGAMDTTGAVELYVNKVAREIAPVRMTGNYGSEILRGNVAFKPQAINSEIFDSELVRAGNTAARTYADEKQCHPVSFIAFKQVPWHHCSRLSVEQSQLTLRAPYLDNEFVQLMYRAPNGSLPRKEPSLRLIWEGNPAIGKIPTDRGLLYRPTPVITKARHFLEEFTFRAEYAYDYGMPQKLAAVDYFLKPFQPEKLFLGRHKFFHFRVWYRDKLGAYLKEVLLDPRTRDRSYLKGKQLEKIVEGHLRGSRNFTTEIHKILTLELIHRHLLERNWSQDH